jgi:hypothetical protein
MFHVCEKLLDASGRLAQYPVCRAHDVGINRRLGAFHVGGAHAERGMSTRSMTEPAGACVFVDGAAGLLSRLTGNQIVECCRDRRSLHRVLFSLRPQFGSLNSRRGCRPTLRSVTDERLQSGDGFGVISFCAVRLTNDDCGALRRTFTEFQGEFGLVARRSEIAGLQQDRGEVTSAPPNFQGREQSPSEDSPLLRRRLPARI